MNNLINNQNTVNYIKITDNVARSRNKNGLSESNKNLCTWKAI